MPICNQVCIKASYTVVHSWQFVTCSQILQTSVGNVEETLTLYCICNFVTIITEVSFPSAVQYGIWLYVVFYVKLIYTVVFIRCSRPAHPPVSVQTMTPKKWVLCQQKNETELVNQLLSLSGKNCLINDNKIKKIALRPISYVVSMSAVKFLCQKCSQWEQRTQCGWWASSWCSSSQAAFFQLPP